MEKAFLNKMTQLLVDSLEKSESDAAYIRKVILRQGEKLEPKEKNQLNEFLGTYGTIEEIESEIQKKFQRDFSKFIAQFTSEFVAADGRLHDCLWLLGGDCLKELEDIFDDDGKTALHSVLKKYIFVFKDLLTLPDAAVQQILRRVETHDLALSLLNSSEELKQKILNNLSKTGGAELLEEIENVKHSALESEIKDAQNNVLTAIQAERDLGRLTELDL